MKLLSIIYQLFTEATEKDIWWSKLSKDEQDAYLKAHPNSTKAKELAKNKPKDVKVEPKKFKPSLTPSEKLKQKEKERNAPSEPVLKKSSIAVDSEKNNKDKILHLKNFIPKASISTKSDLGDIPKKAKRKVSMLIDRLANLATKAKEAGKKAPDYDLCKITVPGTNLYCERNLGIPRAEMPQFKGYAKEGSIASKLPKDPVSGEVDTEAVFEKLLQKKKIKVSDVIEFPSDQLKATQTQLVGAKVAGMTKALEKDSNHPKITAPIYVSRDGYVLDGHHRWAAMTSLAIKRNQPTNMKVRIIDLDGQDLVKLANKFSDDIGIEQKKASTSAK